MAKTRKGVNPIDQEIQEELSKKIPMAEVIEDQSSPEEFGDDFEVSTEKEAEVIPANSSSDPEPKEILLPKRYILSECIYRTSNEERGDYDFSDFLIDLNTIGSLERVFPERLSDFGIDEKTIEDQNLIDSCIIWSTAFAEEIIVLDFNFEELTQSLIEYRETSL